VGAHVSLFSQLRLREGQDACCCSCYFSSCPHSHSFIPFSNTGWLLLWAVDCWYLSSYGAGGCSGKQLQWSCSGKCSVFWYVRIVKGWLYLFIYFAVDWVFFSCSGEWREIDPRECLHKQLIFGWLLVSPLMRCRRLQQSCSGKCSGKCTSLTLIVFFILLLTVAFSFLVPMSGWLLISPFLRSGGRVPVSGHRRRLIVFFKFILLLIVVFSVFLFSFPEKDKDVQSLLANVSCFFVLFSPLWGVDCWYLPSCSVGWLLVSPLVPVSAHQEVDCVYLFCLIDCSFVSLDFFFWFHWLSFYFGRRCLLTLLNSFFCHWTSFSSYSNTNILIIFV